MKNLRSLIALIVLVALVIGVTSIQSIFINAEEESISIIDQVVFPDDQVIDVNIEIEEDTYAWMLENASSETYVLADITYNGYTFSDIAIRPKGNSSLKQVVSANGDRFSFKIDFNKYIDGQNFYGVTKLNLNNLFEDPTLMAESIGYDMLDSIDAVASDTTYVSLSINGEYFGLYLAVEEVDSTFLEDNFGNSDGTLYKPDMGVGADLTYISDDPDDYTGIWPQDDDMSTDEDFIQLVRTISEVAENGETTEYNLSDVLNVDSFAKYLALSTAVIHLDTYQSGMYHNYYIYYNTDTDVFEWISWDLNMIYNGFPMSGLTDEQATQFLIDEPVIGEMSQYPLVQAFFSNDDYVDLYHGYLATLAGEYMNDSAFENKVLETYTLIESYASIDPSAFFTSDVVKDSIFNLEDDNVMSILEFNSQRSANILNQLDGSTVSSNNGSGNEGSGGMKSGMNKQMGGMGEMPDLSELSEEEVAEMNKAMIDVMNGEIPDALMALYEAGELPEEVGEYIKRGEMPPMDLMMELDLMPDGMQGGQRPGMNTEGDAAGNMRPNANQNTEATVGDRPAKGDIAADANTTNEGNAPDEGNVPAEGNAPAEGDMAAGGDMQDRPIKEAGDMAGGEMNQGQNNNMKTDEAVNIVVDETTTISPADLIGIGIALLVAIAGIMILKFKR